MRVVLNPQLAIGQIDIERIPLNPQSRDDIPAVLRGLQQIWSDAELRAKLFTLLETHLLADKSKADSADRERQAYGPCLDARNGRPGMSLWSILVLGLLRQGLNCDYDRLHELAGQHRSVRRMMGLSDWDSTVASCRTITRNVSLLTPQLLADINRLVVGAGYEVLGQDVEGELTARCDSFVVETDVHYPTDVSLLWDAMRSLLRTVARASEAQGETGWRQHKKLAGKVRRLFQRVRTRRRRKNQEKGVKAYLKQCERLLERADGSLEKLQESGASKEEIKEIERLAGLGRKLAGQVERRILKGETIPQEEKVYSIFEDHTRWCVKGKAGVLVELGVPVTIVESAEQFILGHRIMWTEQDVDVAVEVVEQVQSEYPGLQGCSFDKGYYSAGNRQRLDGILARNVMPKKGRLSETDKEREEAQEHVEKRREHPAVESAIANLEQRGLDRVREHGRAGFERAIGLSVVAANVHRLGLILQRRELERLKKERLKIAA